MSEGKLINAWMLHVSQSIAATMIATPKHPEMNFMTNLPHQTHPARLDALMRVRTHIATSVPILRYAASQIAETRPQENTENHSDTRK